MITLKKEKDLQYMRKAGQIVADVLDLIAEIVRPGITTAYIDKAAEDLISREGATPAFKGYRVPGIPIAFPGAVCASINNEIVHGIPSQDRYLEEGDIISIDIPNNKLELLVDEKTIAERKAKFVPLEKPVPNGYLKRYRNMVTSANTGAVFEE